MIDALKKEIEDARQKFREDIKGIQSKKQLIQVKEQYTSRKRGIITGFMNRLRELPPGDKPQGGKWVNEFRNEVEEALVEIGRGLTRVSVSDIDYSLPDYDLPVGKPHLLSQVRSRLEEIFLKMGYEIAYGPEVETEFNNFTALNIQEDHPARDEQDTFFIKDHPEMVLRTHTSPVQIRYMKNHRPPIKIISPGKAFRKDEPDATHTPVFNQIEGLLVDRGIHFSHLKGTLELFIQSFFSPEVTLRFRPGYFPFTEPSAEVDISCFLCQGSDPQCRICKGTGWLEILGSGMVHPRVLLNCNIDPDEYCGFAFGMGIERIALLKYGISDIRMFYDNDLRFLKQFG
jgi:phenylalanyl-tRNA synthetase alpha chain